jgi:PAS domain S-box-containing protein
MASKYILSLSAKTNHLVLRQTKRDVRLMGTLAYQHLYGHHEDENNDIPDEKVSRSPGPIETDFFVSHPENAYGSVHLSEVMTESMKKELAASQGIEYTPFRSTRQETTAATDPGLLVSHPENASGFSHLSETMSESMKAELAALQGVVYMPRDAIRQGMAAPIDAGLLVSSPESAYGFTHAAELMSEALKADVLESQGAEYKPSKSSDEIMFQEFIDNMALMASPESASGFVFSAELLDEDSKSLLSRLQSRVEALPQTLEEAMLDPRAIVITSLTSPFDIVDVNEAWVGLCGYERDEALHKNLGKLLQGPDTNAEAAQSMVSQLKQEHFAESTITNYTKQGRKFQNRVQAGLLSDDQGQTKYFVGVFEELFDYEGEQKMTI